MDEKKSEIDVQKNLTQQKKEELDEIVFGNFNDGGAEISRTTMHKVYVDNVKKQQQKTERELR